MSTFSLLTSIAFPLLGGEGAVSARGEVLA